MKKNLWLVPAIASAGFFLFSVRVMLSDGPFGFVTEHTRNGLSGWSAQVAIDLFTSLTLGLFFAVPQARKHGIRPLPWIVLTVLLGSIGLLAFAARLLYAREAASNDSNGNARVGSELAAGARGSMG
jgi:hypothetical protein